MKKILISLTVLLSASIQNASLASDWIGLNLPHEKATLAEVDADGHELNIGFKKELSAQKKGNKFLYSSFAFQEEQATDCTTGPCSLNSKAQDYVVVAQGLDSCGSIKLTAIDKIELERLTRLDSTLQNGTPRHWIEVTDHSHRTCDDYRKFAWEVKRFDRNGSETVSRSFEGNPAQLTTIQRGWGN